MSDVEGLVAEARHLVTTIVRRASARLIAGADIADTHAIVDEAAHCLEDVEVYALLGGEAETAIQHEIDRLRALNATLQDDQGA